MECVIDLLMPQKINSDQSLNDCIVKFHSNKSAVESVLLDNYGDEQTDNLR